MPPDNFPPQGPQPASEVAITAFALLGVAFFLRKKEPCGYKRHKEGTAHSAWLGREFLAAGYSKNGGRGTAQVGPEPASELAGALCGLAIYVSGEANWG